MAHAPRANPAALSWWSQTQQYFQRFPLPQTEESILFRVLVQLLVIVGIVATDVAAQTEWSIWAIPLSILGAVWSWHRRKHRNIALKFTLAIGMLLMLFVFLSNIVVNLNDTRISLAGLLVQLQVLHSFDLPRRKDLGYSMVIGLILLGVAGTVSQTMVFALWLLLFLAIALPTLVLDYRSRLGLPTFDQLWQRRPGQKQRPWSLASLQNSPLSPKRLGTVLGITLLLGLIIFAVMPRLPSYQLQTFPVSGAGDSENKTFDETNRDVVNPGYVQPGKEGTGGSTGNSPVQGAGSMDETYYYGFSSRINQNLRGQLKKQLVLRVRSQSAGFWRALAFDHYTGQGWEISQNDDITKVRRSPWSYRFDLFSSLNPGRSQRVVQTYTAVKDLPNVIPGLNLPRFLYFPAREVGIDQSDNLRSPVGLQEGLTYTVISEVPFRDRTALNQAPNQFPRRVLQRYLEVPPAIKDKIRQQAIALLDKSPKPINTQYEAALYLTQALKQNYTIKTDIPFLEKNEDLVEAFLFRDQGGYPDHFSTVLTLMLRSLGIPARFTVGFAPGQFNPFTGYYLVHNTDAYGLTEVYFPTFGWISFDPIPGHDLFPPSIEDEETFSVLKQLWNWVASWLPSPVTGFLSLLWTNVIEAFFGFLGWLWKLISGSILGALLGLIGAIALGFLGWLGWEQIRRWLTRQRLARLAPMPRLYQQTLLTLKGRDLAKSSAQTPLEYAHSLQERLTPEQHSIVLEIVQAYVHWRYGNQEPNIPYLNQQLQLLIRSLERQQTTALLNRWRKSG